MSRHDVHGDDRSEPEGGEVGAHEADGGDRHSGEVGGRDDPVVVHGEGERADGVATSPDDPVVVVGEGGPDDGITVTSDAGVAGELDPSGGGRLEPWDPDDRDRDLGDPAGIDDLDRREGDGGSPDDGRHAPPERPDGSDTDFGSGAPAPDGTKTAGERPVDPSTGAPAPDGAKSPGERPVDPSSGADEMWTDPGEAESVDANRDEGVRDEGSGHGIGEVQREPDDRLEDDLPDL